MKFNDTDIKWLGHSSFRITDLVDDRIIYIDPFKISSNAPKADVVLITHSHYDHCSIEDLQKIVNEKTIILAPADSQSSFSGKINIKDSTIAAPDRIINLGPISVESIPAYNTNKAFHPKDNDWIGYVITLNSKKIYHAGDTDFIPEMASLSNIDFALLPVSGKFVMTADEAAKATKAFNPKVAIPMHYGEIVGDTNDAQKFKDLANCEVIILPKEE